MWKFGKVLVVEFVIGIVVYGYIVRIFYNVIVFKYIKRIFVKKIFFENRIVSIYMCFIGEKMIIFK